MMSFRRGRLQFKKGRMMRTSLLMLHPHPHQVHIFGPVTRARARQINYQVLSFLVNPSNVHEHMMLPKIDTFVLLLSKGPSMDKEDGHWSGIKHGKEGARAGKENGASSGDFRTLKPP